MLKHILYPDYESEGLASQPIFIKKKVIEIQKIKVMEIRLILLMLFLTLFGCEINEDYLASPNRVKIKLSIKAINYDTRDSLHSIIDIKTNDLDINYVDNLLTYNKAYPTIFYGKFFVKDSSDLIIKYNVKKSKNIILYLEYNLFDKIERVYLKDTNNITINIRKL